MDGLMVEEIARIAQAERLAEFARYQIVPAGPGAFPRARRLVARGLWSLATLLDGGGSPTRKPVRREADAIT